MTLVHIAEITGVTWAAHTNGGAGGLSNGVSRKLDSTSGG